MVWPTPIELEDENTFEEGAERNRMFSELLNAKSRFEHVSLWNAYNKNLVWRLSGIICAIGPSSKSVETIQDMIAAGMNIAVVDTAFSTAEEHSELQRNVKKAISLNCSKMGMDQPVAVGVDLRGPEIHTGMLGEGMSKVDMAPGHQVTLTTDDDVKENCTKHLIYVDFQDIVNSMRKDDVVFLDEGRIELKVERQTEGKLICRIIVGGSLGSFAKVNLPGIVTNLPVIPPRDEEDLAIAIKYNVDFISLRHVESKIHIKHVRRLLSLRNSNMKIIAKIDTLLGVKNFDDIVELADGVQLCRNGLRAELSPEKLLIAQKAIVAKCIKFGKPVICSGRMLITMLERAYPSRPEILDVANCVLDGVDCLALGKLTAVGANAVESVKVLGSICKEAENIYWYRRSMNDLISSASTNLDSTHCTAINAVQMSINCNASAIIVMTASGLTAKLISRYRPKCPIIAVLRHIEEATKLHIFRGIVPVMYPDVPLADWALDQKARILYAFKYGLHFKFIEYEDMVVIVTGWRKDSGFSNSVRLVKITDEELKHYDFY